MRLRRPLPAALALALLALTPVCSQAQVVPRVEVSVGTAFRPFENDEAGVRTAAGLAGQADVNLNALFAIEARAAWFPREESMRFRRQGGQTLEVSAGGRATFIRKPRWAFYGVALAGVSRASQAATDIDATIGAASRIPSTTPR